MFDTAPDARSHLPIHVARLAERNGWRAEQYGETVSGIPLTAWWPSAAPTRVVWAAIHGEEMTTAQAAHQLLRTVHAEDACAVVVPVANPDGLLAGTRQNANGVDLNRNFVGASWRADPSPTFWPTSMTRTDERRTLLSSPGTHPGSEPEVAALCALVERVQPATVVDLHAPLECVIAFDDAAVPLAERLAEPAGLRIVRELDSPTPGDSASWCHEHGIACVTYEFEAAAFAPLWHRHKAAMGRAITPLPRPVRGA